jgi:transposase-like protein
MRYKYWTEDKLNILRAYLEGGLTVMQIAEKMHKSYKSVENAVCRNGMKSQSEFTKIKESQSPIEDTVSNTCKIKKTDINLIPGYLFTCIIFKFVSLFK